MRSIAHLLYLTIAACLAIESGPCLAASVTLNTNVISIEGKIDSATATDFRLLTSQIRDWGLVMLNSEGGDMSSALAIGHIIRARNFETDVTRQAVCASACVFVLAAGVDRSAYGRIGIHRPHYDGTYFAGLTPSQAREKYDELVFAARNYLQEMGMPEQLAVAIMRVPSDRVTWLTPGDISAFNLNSIDPGYEEWLRSQYDLRFGPNGYRRHIEGLNLFGKCRGDSECWHDIQRRYPEAFWDPRAR